MNAFNQKSLLVVDDSPMDVEMLKLAFLKAGGKNPIVHKEDGEDAISHLNWLLETGQHQGHPLPVAILTDLKMPKVDGFDLLKWVRGKSALDHVLAVVITGSTIEADVRRAFELGANFFFTKPAQFADFVIFATNFLAWLQLNRYPEEPTAPPPRSQPTHNSATSY